MPEVQKVARTKVDMLELPNQLDDVRQLRPLAVLPCDWAYRIQDAVAAPNAPGKAESTRRSRPSSI